MLDLKKMALLKEVLDNIDKNVNSAKQLLAEAFGETDLPKVDLKTMSTSLSDSSLNEGAKIIEGIFDGQNMIDKEENTYPVPANYASKSKLVTGDLLKLTITEEGRFLYKQIGPTERQYVVGPLTYDDGQYRILTKDQSYKVLTASVTYFKAEIGDEITLIIPKNSKTEWGAVEAVLPNVGDVEIAKEKKPKKKTASKTKAKAKIEDELEGDDLDF